MRNGSGTYSLPSGNPVVTGTSISSTGFNNTMTDIATALSGSLAADGQTAWAGNQNANGNRVRNMGAASASTDSATLGDVKAQIALQAAVNGFRLTLQSGTPVPQTDQIGSSTVYATPYKGSSIALYASGAWGIYTSAEFSLALSGLTVNRPHDIWCYANGTTPTLEVLPWTSITARATALAYQDGVLVKAGDPTRRYLGTLASLSATTTEDSKRQRLLFNYYHRCRRPVAVSDATASWTYSTAAWRQANGNASNQINFMCGVAEDAVSLRVAALATNTASGAGFNAAIGVDTTAASSGVATQGVIPVANGYASSFATLEDYPQAGFHFYAWIENNVSGTGTLTWNGPNSGLTGSVLA